MKRIKIPFSTVFSTASSIALGTACIIALGMMSTAAQASPNDPFDFTALMALIHDHSVTTLDELIPLLPDTYQKNFVLMNQSGSLQSASAESPRVIAFGNYENTDVQHPEKSLDRLFLGFQSNRDPAPKSKLPNSLEVIEWSPTAKNYLFYQVDFPITANSVTRNPTTCMQCHGTPLRPNWTAYPRWDGAIGNANGLDGSFNILKSDTAPGEAQNAFNTLQNKNSRLKSLDFGEYFSKKLENPNANLSEKIHNQLTLRDVQLIKQRDDYAQLKYAIAGAFVGCVNVNDFFSPTVYAQLQSGVFASLKSAPLTLKSSLVSAPSDITYKNTLDLSSALYQTSTHFVGFAEDAAITTWLRYLYEGQGKPEVLKNLLGSPPMDPDNKSWNYDLVSFGTGWSSVRSQYLENLDDDADLANLDLFNNAMDEAKWRLSTYSVGGPDILENGPAKNICQTLALKSRQYANLSSPTTNTPFLQSTTIPVATDPLSSFTHYCMECHGPDDDHPLRLDNFDALKAYRTRRGETIAQRLNRMEMPPASAPQPSDAIRKAMADAVQ
jgi:cytochrome c553